MVTWATILYLLPGLALVSCHGNMFSPPAWWDRGSTNTKIGCGVLNLPDNEYSDVHNGRDPDCMSLWYSNNVKIPGKASIPDDMDQSEITCTHQAGAHDDKKEFPWNAPGSAPVFGPCGTLGGWPHGCNGDNKGDFGDCCSGNCDGFALGKNAEEYHWPGEIPITPWFAGSNQEVQWYVGANHAGGYSYRLCKLPEGGIKELTEECFQEIPLDFVGDNQWVVYGKDLHSLKRTKIHAKRTREGTFPSGSMWTANPLLPHMEEGGSSDYGHGQVIDKVQVPAGLEPGEYVLSFRWDSKCSPQVWGSCSNVLII